MYKNFGIEVLNIRSNNCIDKELKITKSKLDFKNFRQWYGCTQRDLEKAARGITRLTHHYKRILMVPLLGRMAT